MPKKNVERTLAPATVAIRAMAEAIADYLTRINKHPCYPNYDLSRSHFYAMVDQHGWRKAFTMTEIIVEDARAGRLPGISLPERKPRWFRR